MLCTFCILECFTKNLYSILLCMQAAELQEKLSKTLEENQKLQEKLVLLSREKQATDKKVMKI